MEPKIHYHVHKSPLLMPILSQMNPVHIFPSYLSKVHYITFFHLRLRLPSGLFRLGFPTKILYAFVISPMCVAYTAHLSEDEYTDRNM